MNKYIVTIIDIAIEYEAQGINMRMLRSMANARHSPFGKSSMQSIKGFAETLKKQKLLDTLREQHEPFPADSIKPFGTSEDDFKKAINSIYKTDQYEKVFMQFPADLREQTFDAFRKSRIIHNRYGYWPKWMGEIGVDCPVHKLISTKLAKSELRKTRLKEDTEFLKSAIDNINSWYEKEITLSQVSSTHEQ
jgi:hypothetical protein